MTVCVRIAQVTHAAYALHGGECVIRAGRKKAGRIKALVYREPRGNSVDSAEDYAIERPAGVVGNGPSSLY